MVTVKNLVKRYGEFSLDVSMEIPAGRITGLIGRNGAGKSTMIKSVLGLIRPDEGQITVLGKEPYKFEKEDKRQIGVALAEVGFSTYLAVEDIAKIMKKLYPTFEETVFLKKCADMRLPQKKLIKDFSTGMKARLRVLVAMSHNAKLLIMDEPTAGLDVEARLEIQDMIREYMLEDEERAVLLTSHISTDLESLCDDIYMIDNGKIILHEDTDTILSHYAIIKVEESKMASLDQQYILKYRKESYGYECLTNEKQYYIDNYPGLTIEKAGIDDLILVLTGGKK
ncbi:MAG: ABC transporter ATP-binding protein [Eubacteriales bacterium]|nr:ABC transporter ATP-binding protein [Eubacteriales bacterium]